MRDMKRRRKDIRNQGSNVHKQDMIEAEAGQEAIRNIKRDMNLVNVVTDIMIKVIPEKEEKDMVKKNTAIIMIKRKILTLMKEDKLKK